MGTSVSHNHQRNYRPEGEEVERRNVRGEDNKYVNTEQSGVK
jgi:transposase